MAVRLAGEVVVLLWLRDFALAKPRASATVHRAATSPPRRSLSLYGRWSVARLRSNVEGRGRRSRRNRRSRSRARGIMARSRWHRWKVTNADASRRPRIEKVDVIPLDELEWAARGRSVSRSAYSRSANSRRPTYLRTLDATMFHGVEYRIEILSGCLKYSFWNRYGQHAEFRSHVESFPFLFATYDYQREKEIFLCSTFRRLNFHR